MGKLPPLVEPLYGYYFSDDEWVVRRHMKLIMQAGIDFLFFDTRNSFVYERNAKLVMRVLRNTATRAGTSRR